VLNFAKTNSFSGHFAEEKIDSKVTEVLKLEFFE
jgi:hypothetical protein